MKQVPIKLGPLALLLTVISICLTVLAILSYSTARADMRLAEKYASTVTDRYALEVEGQTLLREIRRGGDPPNAETDEDGTLWVLLERDGFRLRMGLAPGENGEYEVVAWRQDKEWTQDTDIGNLWAGN